MNKHEKKQLQSDHFALYTIDYSHHNEIYVIFL